MTDQETLIAQGVPARLTVGAARNWMSSRVSERRFKHVEGVADTACELALASGCDLLKATLAGWLHDCCKELNDKELVDKAREFGLALHPIEEQNGHLLHGPVGAQTVRREWGLTNSEILDAIAQHTLGEIEMSTLAKVIFLADCLEPHRPPTIQSRFGKRYMVKVSRIFLSCEVANLIWIWRC